MIDFEEYWHSTFSGMSDMDYIKYKNLGKLTAKHAFTAGAMSQAEENAKLKEALREAVQTLEFYARVNNWHTDGVVLHCMDVISVSDTEYCSINEKYGGRRAREFQSKHAAIIAEINPPTMGDK